MMTMTTKGGQGKKGRKPIHCYPHSAASPVMICPISGLDFCGCEGKRKKEVHLLYTEFVMDDYDLERIFWSAMP